MAEKQGFLQKEGDKFKTWKKRWFVSILIHIQIFSNFSIHILHFLIVFHFRFCRFFYFIVFFSFLFFFFSR
jgi:hypothetical protein